MIVKDGDKWCVKSKDGSKSFGCYDSKKAAEERLAEVEMFKSIGKNMKHKGK